MIAFVANCPVYHDQQVIHKCLHLANNVWVEPVVAVVGWHYTRLEYVAVPAIRKVERKIAFTDRRLSEVMANHRIYKEFTCLRLSSVHFAPTKIMNHSFIFLNMVSQYSAHGRAQEGLYDLGTASHISPADAVERRYE